MRASTCVEAIHGFAVEERHLVLFFRVESVQEKGQWDPTMQRLGPKHSMQVKTQGAMVSSVQSGSAMPNPEILQYTFSAPATDFSAERQGSNELAQSSAGALGVDDDGPLREGKRQIAEIL